MTSKIYWIGGISAGLVLLVVGIILCAVLSDQWYIGLVLIILGLGMAAGMFLFYYYQGRDSDVKSPVDVGTSNLTAAANAIDMNQSGAAMASPSIPRYDRRQDLRHDIMGRTEHGPTVILYAQPPSYVSNSPAKPLSFQEMFEPTPPH